MACTELELELLDDSVPIAVCEFVLGGDAPQEDAAWRCDILNTSANNAALCAKATVQPQSVQKAASFAVDLVKGGNSRAKVSGGGRRRGKGGGHGREAVSGDQSDSAECRAHGGGGGDGGIADAGAGADGGDQSAGCGNGGSVDIGRTQAVLFASIRKLLSEGRLHQAEALLRGASSQTSVCMFNDLIHAFTRNGCNLGRAEMLFAEMLRRGMCPNIHTISGMMNACAEHGEVEKANYYSDEVAARYGLMHNEVSFNTMIKVCALKGDLLRAEGLIQKMKEAGVAPSVTSYNSVLRCCVRVDQVERAEAVVREMEGAGIKANHVTYNTLINMCASRHDRVRAEYWASVMQAAGVTPTEITYATLCKVYARFGLISQVERLMQIAEASGLAINEFFYASLIIACGACTPLNMARAMRAVTELSDRGLDVWRVRGALSKVLGSGRATRLLLATERCRGGRRRPRTGAGAQPGAAAGAGAVAGAGGGAGIPAVATATFHPAGGAADAAVAAAASIAFEGGGANVAFDLASAPIPPNRFGAKVGGIKWAAAPHGDAAGSNASAGIATVARVDMAQPPPLPTKFVVPKPATVSLPIGNRRAGGDAVIIERDTARQQQHTEATNWPAMRTPVDNMHLAPTTWNQGHVITL